MFSLLFVSLLTHFYVQVPCAPLYEAPRDDAPLVSEAIFAEEVTVVDTQAEWAAVELSRTERAWMRKELLFEREKAYADCTCHVPMVEVNGHKALFYSSMNADAAPSLVLPFECRLESEDPFSPSPWLKINLPNATELYVRKNEITSELQPKSKEQLIAFSKEFVGVPFKQAGTTSFGFDSAGFIQMLYRQMGVFLPRTLQAQCDYSELEAGALDSLEPGDLIFWGLSAERMEHVAMLLENNQCIHVATDRGVQIVPLHAVSSLPIRVGRRLR
jgi:hypothetical protein